VLLAESKKWALSCTAWLSWASVWWAQRCWRKQERATYYDTYTQHLIFKLYHGMYHVPRYKLWYIPWPDWYIPPDTTMTALDCTRKAFYTSSMQDHSFSSPALWLQSGSWSEKKGTLTLNERYIPGRQADSVVASTPPRVPRVPRCTQSMTS
jgi:hypothetical protein